MRIRRRSEKMSPENRRYPSHRVLQVIQQTLAAALRVGFREIERKTSSNVNTIIQGREDGGKTEMVSHS